MRGHSSVETGIVKLNSLVCGEMDEVFDCVWTNESKHGRSLIHCMCTRWYWGWVTVLLRSKDFLSGQHQLAPLMLVIRSKRLAQSSHVNNNQKGLNE